jgi:hypothetical protein
MTSRPFAGNRTRARHQAIFCDRLTAGLKQRGGKTRTYLSNHSGLLRTSLVRSVRFDRAWPYSPDWHRPLRLDPICMVRPCVAREFRRVGGERSCVNVSGLCLEHRAPGHHGYQRACDLISGPASSRPIGSPGFACAGKTEPPSRHVLSQTSADNKLAK